MFWCCGVSRQAVNVDVVSVAPPHLWGYLVSLLFIILWCEGWNPGPYIHWESDINVLYPQACYYFTHDLEVDTVVQGCNPNTWEAEAEDPMFQPAWTTQ